MTDEKKSKSVDDPANVDEPADSADPGRVDELKQSVAKLKRKLDDQQDRIEALARGREEGMVTVGELREELALVASERDRLRKQLTQIEGMQTEELIAATEGMEVDDLADLLADLPEAVTRQVLQSLDRLDHDRLQQVLAYDEDSAGGLMNVDIVTVRPDVTLEVVSRYLRAGAHACHLATAPMIDPAVGIKIREEL